MMCWIITVAISVAISVLLYHAFQCPNEYGSQEDVERFTRNVRGDYRQ